MSTTTTPEPSQKPPITLLPTAGPPIETAPSAMVTEGPALARLLGLIGLACLVAGLAGVIATKSVGPRLFVSEGTGIMLGALGLVLMLYHAAVDKEYEVRRGYSGLAVFLLIVAVVISLLPGPFEGTGNKAIGYYLLPWGVSAGLMGLLFTITATRNETDEKFQEVANLVLLSFGGLLTVGSVSAGVFQPEFLAGPGLVLAILGLGFVWAYLSRVDTSQGIGYTVAFTLGVVGALAIIYAFVRTVFPPVLYEGPSVLRKADQTYDNWKLFIRGLTILAFLALATVGLVGRFALWLRASFAVVGLCGAAVFFVASVSSPVSVQPKPFLVPGGVILAGIGVLYMAVALGICSDNQFVTLTRRELAAYFFSPIGILVLGVMVLAQWLSYLDFVGQLSASGSIREPIVQRYGAHILNLFVYVVQIPVLTMRLLAEEKRTGSLEVLLTAPVNESTIVGSKFLGTLIFFLICWLPVGLFLIALRAVAEQPFDYRPILGFYVGLVCQGGMFIAMGLFFSSLTKNQIVAALMTFVVLEGLLFFTLLRESPLMLKLPDAVFNVAYRLSFYHIWVESLSGQVPLRDLLLSISLTIFGLFLTVKILEIRKWS